MRRQVVVCCVGGEGRWGWSVEEQEGAEAVGLRSRGSSGTARCVGGIVVSIAAFQAVDPGSIPGQRRALFFSQRAPQCLASAAPRQPSFARGAQAVRCPSLPCSLRARPAL